MTDNNADVIDTLVGITPGSHLDRVRAQRVEARDNAQQSYLALFAPRDPGSVPWPNDLPSPASWRACIATPVSPRSIAPV
jgi:hypothetical protein